jgi:hypothetical protein
MRAQFSLRFFMASVVYFAVGFWVLIQPSMVSAGLMFSELVTLLVLSLVVGLGAQGPRRIACLAFFVCGATHLGLALAPPMGSYTSEYLPTSQFLDHLERRASNATPSRKSLCIGTMAASAATISIASNRLQVLDWELADSEDWVDSAAVDWEESAVDWEESAEDWGESAEGWEGPAEDWAALREA